MKKSFISILALVSLFSCQKEMIKPDAVNPVNPVSSANAAPQIYRAQNIYPVDDIRFNPCTLEDVHLTGAIKTEESYTIAGKTFNYTFKFHYEGVSGVALTTGKIYKGTGNYIDNNQAKWSNAAGGYLFAHENSKLQISFTSPGSPSVMSTGDAHFVIKPDGTVIISEINFNWDYCK